MFWRSGRFTVLSFYMLRTCFFSCGIAFTIGEKDKDIIANY